MSNKGKIEDGFANIFCGTLMLGGPSLIAIGIIIGLVFAGVSSQLIEKAMVVLAVPWFAFCYFLCKWPHYMNAKISHHRSKQELLEQPLYRRRPTTRKRV